MRLSRKILVDAKISKAERDPYGRESGEDLAEGNGAEHAVMALSPPIFLRSRVKNDAYGDFPCGPVGKNPPPSAGGTGSIPGQGRSHTPQSN